MRGDSSPDDATLLARFRDGELEAFEGLVERYQAPLLRFAQGTLRDASAAEDVVQETFMRFIRHAPELSLDPARNGSDGALSAWLFRVCRNLAYDLMKTETRERRRREKVARPEADPQERMPAEEAELTRLVGGELERLPAKQREVVRLKVQQGLSYRQISEATGLKPGYIGWLVHTGLTQLTDRLRAAGALG